MSISAIEPQQTTGIIMKKDQLKKGIKMILGITKVNNTLKKVVKRVSVEEPGDYLFTQKIVSWMADPTLKRQLPFFYRLFASLCIYRIFRNDKVNCKFRKITFSIMSRLPQLFRMKESTQLCLRDYKVCIDLLDPRSVKVVYELLNIRNQLINYLSEGDTFIDVGANHGSYSIIASKLVGRNGLIIAVEPQPRLAKLLETSLSLNKCYHYEIHQIACGNRNDSVEFYIPSFNSGEGGIFPGFSAIKNYHKIKVNMKRFDEAFDWRNFPGKVFMKVDIEGSEYEFLTGAKEMISARKPVIMLEVHPFISEITNVTGSAFRILLSELGYQHYIDRNNPMERFSVQDLDTTRAHNIILLPTEN